MTTRLDRRQTLPVPDDYTFENSIRHSPAVSNLEDRVSTNPGHHRSGGISVEHRHENRGAARRVRIVLARSDTIHRHGQRKGMTAMDQGKHAADSSFDALRERYRHEQQKRLRPEGLAQWRELSEELDRDPFVEPNFTRGPVVEDTTVVIVGGGFAGMLTAIDLAKHGITDVRIVEKAGDFGGTWYWNRYPGCMCDVESFVYLPLLEETGFMPTERYASASEIFEYAKLLARKFDLYSHAHFQTNVTGAEWDEGSQRWRVTTSRGDRLSSRFVVLAGGILHKAKLPGISGIEEFEGKAFHTSRWDYGYTGGSPTELMDRLADKRVGIIGTGATAVQVVPQIARVAKELYVFQRTPGAVGVRNQGPTDVGWFTSLKPGWQHERIINFTQAVTGAKPAVNLVDDGWTELLWIDTQKSSSAEEAEELERIDFEAMETIRQRIDEIVDDPETADKLKPYWGKHCKRVCFHDDYLPSFNRPNVHLVDTNGRGVEACTGRGPIVDGVEYPVDLLIYASGFEVTTDLTHRLGFDLTGRDGVTLSEKWSEGAHTLHGVLASGFPNLLLISLVQGGFGTNFSHLLSESAKHVAHIIEACIKQGIVAIEPEDSGEEEWLSVLLGVGIGGARYFQNCTPSFYNSEQQAIDGRAARNLTYTGSLLDYVGYLERWREQPAFAGVTLRFGKVVESE
jgi:cation diffusion facilitator CzcD-associated flavoprotein CzcO